MYTPELTIQTSARESPTVKIFQVVGPNAKGRDGLDSGPDSEYEYFASDAVLEFGLSSLRKSLLLALPEDETVEASTTVNRRDG